MVERPVVSSQRREPAERSAGAVARTGTSRSVPFRRFATSAQLARAFSIVPIFGNPAHGTVSSRSCRRGARTSDDATARLACSRSSRAATPNDARGELLRASRALARAGPIPRRERPHRGGRACPPADAGRRGLDVRDFPRFRRGGAVVFSVFTSPHPRAFSRLRANEPRSRRPSPHPSPSPPSAPRQSPKDYDGIPDAPPPLPADLAAELLDPGDSPPRSSTPGSVGSGSRRDSLASVATVAARQSLGSEMAHHIVAEAEFGWSNPAAPAWELTHARARANHRPASARDDHIVAEAGGAFARTAAAVPPRRRTRTRTRPRYRPARWRVRVPRVLEERARVWGGGADGG